MPIQERGRLVCGVWRIEDSGSRTGVGGRPCRYRFSLGDCEAASELVKAKGLSAKFCGSRLESRPAGLAPAPQPGTIVLP
jgi:hypothetical protein